MNLTRFVRNISPALLAVMVLASVILLGLKPGTAVDADGDFSLQVTPSPLVTTIKPGQTTELEVKIRNTGTAPEQLKIQPRSFTIDPDSSEIILGDTAPAEVVDWVRFSAPTFTIRPGEWFTQKVTLSPPASAGFSYSFALQITRKEAPLPIEGRRVLEGSVAIFTLINIDRPDATKKIELATFTSDRNVYEYIPASFKVSFKNSGNTIIQPYGTIYIQRGSKDTNPISTLAVNANKGYILPGSTRSLNSSWGDGFPAYVETSSGPGGETGKQLKWDWNRLNDFRIGKYTAKLVAVYNDGKRDVPIEAEVSFWVIPWMIILGVLVIALLLGYALWSIVSKIFRRIRRKKPRN